MLPCFLSVFDSNKITFFNPLKSFFMLSLNVILTLNIPSFFDTK